MKFMLSGFGRPIKAQGPEPSDPNPWNLIPNLSQLQALVSSLGPYFNSSEVPGRLGHLRLLGLGA